MVYLEFHALLLPIRGLTESNCGFIMATAEQTLISHETSALDFNLT